MTHRIARFPDPARTSIAPEGQPVEGPVEERTPLDAAIDTQHSRNTVTRDGGVDPQAPDYWQQVRQVLHKRDGSIARVLQKLEEWHISDSDAQEVLDLLQELPPLHLNQALRKIQDVGLLGDLVSNLTPEQLLQFTRRLAETGIFKWKPAVDEADVPLTGAPLLIEQSDNLPNELRALAHDINVAVAKRHPGHVLYEPGGSKLDPRERQWLDWIGGVRGTVQTLVNRLDAVTDIDSAVHQLRPDESYRLTSDTSAGVKLGKKVGSGAEVSFGPAISSGLEVKRAGERYEVSIESSVLAQASAELELSTLLKLGGSVGTGGGGRVEFAYDTADQASRAAQMLVALDSPIVLAALASDPSARALLTRHISAVELGPEAAASLGLSSPIAERFQDVGAVKGELKAATATRLRVELEDGRPAVLVSKTSVQFDASASAKQKGFDVSIASPVGTSVKAEVEQSTPIPPGGTLAAAGGALLAKDAKVTVTLESTGGIPGFNGANEVEFEGAGEPAALLRAAWALGSGDSAGAVRVLAACTVTARKTSTARFGVGAKVGAGVEVSSSLSMSRKRIHQKTQLVGPERDRAVSLLGSLSPADAKPGALAPLDRGLLRGG